MQKDFIFIKANKAISPAFIIPDNNPTINYAKYIERKGLLLFYYKKILIIKQLLNNHVSVNLFVQVLSIQTYQGI